MGKLHVPISQLGAMRDAKKCFVMVRGRDEDIPLKVSRHQFRKILHSGGADRGEEDWTVIWRAPTKEAVLEVSDGYGDIHVEGASQCDQCCDYFPPAEVGEHGEMTLCHDCWGKLNKAFDLTHGGRY